MASKMNTDDPHSEQKMTDSSHRMKVPFNKNRKFICVEYPGIIENTEYAMKTIGGEEVVSETYSDESKRLPLQWRPNDKYCKPAYGERNNTTTLLMKVKVRRKKSTKEICQCSAEVLGTVETTYKFKGLADFQYLPVEEKNGKPVQFLDKLVIEGMEDRQEFFSRDAPLFVPPVSFCRTDTPDKDYQFRPRVVHKPGYEDPEAGRPPNLIGPVREKRTVHTIFFNYGDDVPKGNTEEALKNLREKLKGVDNKEEEMDRLFQIRPIWSRFALSHYYSGNAQFLKYLLPMKAYYCLNGPWRSTWIKYGYDPTKNPEAKNFQTIDFRIRQSVPTGNFAIERKRGLNFQMYTAKNRKNVQTTLINPATIAVTLGKSSENVTSGSGGSLEEKGLEEEEEEEQAGKHIYLPNRLPYCRQVFYQIVDIREPKAHKILNSFTAKACSQKSGWFSQQQIAKVRDVMTEQTKEILKQKGLYFWPPTSKHARNLQKRKVEQNKQNLKHGVAVSDDEEDELEEEEDDGNEGQEQEMHDGKEEFSEEEEEMEDPGEDQEEDPGEDQEADEEMEFERTFSEVNHDILEFL